MTKTNQFNATILANVATDREVREFLLILHEHNIIGDFCAPRGGETLADFKGWAYSDVHFSVFLNPDDEQDYYLNKFCGEEWTNIKLNRLILAGKISLTYENSTETTDLVEYSDWFDGTEEDWVEFAERIPTLILREVLAKRLE